MAEVEKRIALLIDADNAPAGKIDVILAEVARHGVANVRRAYGNWKSPGLKGWEAVLHEYAIRPIQQFAYSSGKNASDMAMVVDAMDLLYARNLDGFAIVSSDADFTPMVMRLLTDGVKVYGFGEQKTPKPFVNACSKFTYIEALGAPAENGKATSATKKGAQELRGDTRLVQMLRSAVETTSGDDGWANLSVVGSQISNKASFDSRNYGYGKLSDLGQGQWAVRGQAGRQDRAGAGQAGTARGEEDGGLSRRARPPRRSGTIGARRRSCPASGRTRRAWTHEAVRPGGGCREHGTVAGAAWRWRWPWRCTCRFTCCCATLANGSPRHHSLESMHASAWSGRNALRHRAPRWTVAAHHGRDGERAHRRAGQVPAPVTAPASAMVLVQESDVWKSPTGTPATADGQ